MALHSPEFAATTMRHQYATAYEAVITCLYLQDQIRIEKTKNASNLQIRSTRVQILQAALELIRRDANTHVLAALHGKDELLRMTKDDESTG